jgi:hypothetical protein
MDHPSPRLLNRGHRAPGEVPPDHSGEVPGPIASPVLGGGHLRAAISGWI